MGRRHVKLVAAQSRARLVAIVDPAPEARAYASAARTRWFATIDELLAAEPPDGAIVATPNALHHAHAAMLIAAGVPVLVEKPVATTAAEGEAIAEAAAGSDVPVLVGHHRRHSPRLLAARELIHGGRIGEVVAVSATTLLAKPAEYFDAALWRREPGGGPILINLIHDVDVLRMLCGDVVEVQAQASSSVRGRPVEETVAVTLRFADGAVGTLLLSDAAASPIGWEQTSGEDPAYPLYGSRDCYIITGTRGTIALPTMRLTTASGHPSWHRRMRETVVPVVPGDPLARQLDHFVGVVRGEEVPLVTIRDAVESLRVTLAVAAAVRDGVKVACAPAGRRP
jgi:predicted dehydrogenase